MTTTFLAPDPIQGTFFIPGGNTPGNGVQLFCYTAGSSTKQTVYKDNAAATPWSNPIVLDSGGNLPSGGEVWIPTGVTVKFVYAPSNDTDPPASPYRTLDNISGVNDVSVTAQSEWVAGPAPTFVSGTQFTLSGDQTATFTAGRRLKTTNTAGTVYSTITSVSFAANTTTVNIANDSGALDSGLSAVFYGILDPSNPSTASFDINRKGTTVASAGNGTTNIWSVTGDYAHISGTNSIRSFSTAPYAGALRGLVFDGALTLFSSASLLIPGNQNISTSANDRASVRADTISTFVLTDYVRADGRAPLITQPTRTIISSAGSTGTYLTPAGAVRLTARLVGGGAGGAGSGSAPGNGTNGSSTTFGTLTAGGGSGAVSQTGGAGGTATNGDVNVTGGSGGDGANLVNYPGGDGGKSVYGGVGITGANKGPSNNPGTLYGSGGAGAGSSSGAGPSGGGGGAGSYLEKFIIPPVTSYAYTVASFGVGGGAGGGGYGGGGGAGGLIIIDEYYT